MGIRFLLHVIFLAQGSSPHLLLILHYRWILYCWATITPPHVRSFLAHLARVHGTVSLRRLPLNPYTCHCSQTCHQHLSPCPSSVVRRVSLPPIPHCTQPPAPPVPSNSFMPQLSPSFLILSPSPHLAFSSQHTSRSKSICSYLKKKKNFFFASWWSSG